MLNEINDYLQLKKEDFTPQIDRLMKAKTDKEELSIANEIIAQKREAERIFYDIFEIVNKKGNN